MNARRSEGAAYWRKLAEAIDALSSLPDPNDFIGYGVIATAQTTKFDRQYSAAMRWPADFLPTPGLTIHHQR